MVLCSVLICALAISFVSGAKIPCEDKASYCNELNVEKCRPPNVAWATKNCPLRCGLCGSNSVDPDATNTGTNDKSKTPRNSCQDKLSNCHNYNVTSCRAPYLAWAKDKCERRCGLCGIDIGGPKPTNSCKDKLSNCQNYGVKSCRAPYLAWAKKNCEKRCDLCNVEVKVDVKDTIKRSCNYRGKTWAYGYRWIETRAGGNNYDCECMTYGRIDCIFAGKEKQSCYDHGQKRLYGQRWVERRSSGAQYDCKCMDNARIDCIVVSNCHDDNQSCYGWALKGECTINPRYMLLNCRRSCGRC